MQARRETEKEREKQIKRKKIFKKKKGSDFSIIHQHETGNMNNIHVNFYVMTNINRLHVNFYVIHHHKQFANQFLSLLLDIQCPANATSGQHDIYQSLIHWSWHIHHLESEGHWDKIMLNELQRLLKWKLPFT